ncbi:MAG: DUF4870 domain-containing protein [Myxococcota bacterium]
MTPQDQQSPIQSVGGDTVREQDKIQLVLAYLSCLALIPLLTVKDSEFVKWHAKQGLTLGVASFIILAVFAFLGPLAFINCALGPGVLVLCILGILKALKGERWRIPLIADLSEKF